MPVCRTLRRDGSVVGTKVGEGSVCAIKMPLRMTSIEFMASAYLWGLFQVDRGLHRAVPSCGQWLEGSPAGGFVPQGTFAIVWGHF